MSLANAAIPEKTECIKESVQFRINDCTDIFVFCGGIRACCLTGEARGEGLKEM